MRNKLFFDFYLYELGTTFKYQAGILAAGREQDQAGYAAGHVAKSFSVFLLKKKRRLIPDHTG